MTEQSSNRCVVLLPAGDPHYVRLFDELFALAIKEAGLVPHRIAQSLTDPFPIDRLVREIATASAVFADLSQNSDEIWFTLGLAVALKKQLCLVSSTLEFSLPLNIQDFEIIRYPAAPLPSDYRELERSITDQLQAKPPTEAAPQLPKPQPEATPVDPSPTITPIAPPSSSLSEELTAHEVLALAIIDLHASDEGLSPRALGLEMQTNESAHLTSHAMNSLKRRKFIERRSVSVAEGPDCYISDNLFITWLGKNWLLQHRQRTNPLRSNASTRDLMSSTR